MGYPNYTTPAYPGPILLVVVVWGQWTPSKIWVLACLSQTPIPSLVEGSVTAAKVVEQLCQSQKLRQLTLWFVVSCGFWLW